MWGESCRLSLSSGVWRPRRMPRLEADGLSGLPGYARRPVKEIKDLISALVEHVSVGRS